MRRYAQFKADFELINTPEVAQLFSDLDASRNRIAVLEETAANLDRLRSELDEAATPEALLLRPPLEEWPETTRKWWEENIATELDLAATSEAVRKALADAIAAIDKQQTAIRSLIEAQSAAVAETAAKLRVQTQADPAEEVARDQREERKTRFDSTTERRADYLEAYNALEDALSARETLVGDLEAVEKEIASRREGSRNDLLAKLNAAETGLPIGIDLKVGGDRSAAIAYMRDEGFLTRDSAGHFREKEIAERLCAMAKPTTIARALLAGDTSLLEADGVVLGATGAALTSEEAKRLVDHFVPFSPDSDASVTVVERDRLLQILRLQERPIDDEMRILLGTKPVDELSPGQRSSAMLPLVALSETAPLVIDQPEDNLDQRMIGKTLTKILADLKETRQIIVTTHNPNILVGGDAEQVIV